MSHKAKILKVYAVADGLLAVHARCCDDPSTESVLTLCQVDRATELIDADVQDHLSRVEKLHAARDHAKAHIERLCPKSE